MTPEEQKALTVVDIAARFHLESSVVERVLASAPQESWALTLGALSNLGEGQIRFTTYSPSVVHPGIENLPETFDASLFTLPTIKPDVLG